MPQSHGLAVIDLGLNQQLRYDWMTTGPVALDAYGTVADPSTKTAWTSNDPGPLCTDTNNFWNDKNWNPQLETFAYPMYTLHYDQKQYTMGLMWRWAKKMREYRHEDVLTCGRRFQTPPPELTSASPAATGTSTS